jgi:hypothetical protein
VVDAPTPVKRPSYNPNGRPKGTPNRNTATMRFMIEQIIAGQTANVDQALRDILNGRPPVIDATTGQLLVKGVAPNPVGFMAAYTGLADFSLPRLSRVEVKAESLVSDEIEIPAGASQEEAQRAYLRLVSG